ncbi:MAG: hypothetical protein KC475_09785 [Cyanobacteria bacterium HKST-UBA03]|nr:hypothetical protein [Cyanobacteria bacterium HKST-UBA03]
MKKPAQKPHVSITEQQFTRCNARSKRHGGECGQPAIKGRTKCRFHGGLSTGPKTELGKALIGLANRTHGFYTKEEKLARRFGYESLKAMQEAVNNVLEEMKQ